MSFIAKYIAYTLSRITLFTTAEPLPNTNGPLNSSTKSETSPTHRRIPALARGFVLTAAKPNLKAPAAGPQLTSMPASTTPPTRDPPANLSTTSGSGCSSFFDISLISDTSTFSSSSSEDEHTGLLSLSAMLASHPHDDLSEVDLFSPRRARSGSPLSPRRLLGLGISGLPRKDGKPGAFNGLGLVGVRRSSHNQHRDPFMVDDEDEDGYASPTPRRFHPHDDEDGVMEDEWAEEEDVSAAVLSEAFLHELVYTWETDPLHMRLLTTIPECEDEDEDEDGNKLKLPICSASSVPAPTVLPLTQTRSANKARTQSKPRRKLRTHPATDNAAPTRGRSSTKSTSSHATSKQKHGSTIASTGASGAGERARSRRR
ncbi:hypothetical protein D9615_009641 [Tricholomella constricta]|uniref:Uncharacterized protein n=1 Tax=Tricholomella constricta TaxID=117010 RepID=A0A8H5GVC6_9AGAR|nr:hypothetical protein D9615_009641 [Tricholomella constricta]